MYYHTVVYYTGAITTTTKKKGKRVLCLQILYELTDGGHYAPFPP